jgi:hypothetical protein
MKIETRTFCGAMSAAWWIFCSSAFNLRVRPLIVADFEDMDWAVPVQIQVCTTAVKRDTKSAVVQGVGLKACRR